MSITSGLAPIRNYANGGMSEEEQFKEAMKSQVIAKIEERLGIEIPRGSKESEDALINSIIGGVTDLPISKRGDEITYGDNDGFSFYINPKEEGAGVRYNKRFAEGGIATYANGGDVNTKRQNMLAKLGFPSGMTNEQVDAAIAEEERISGIASGFNAPKTADDLKQDVKDYVFDYTDPLEYATLPFLAPKAAMKGKKIFDAVRGPGSKTSQNLRGLGAYIGTDILARDVLGYENPFGDDAQDEAQKDLEDVNKKEEEEKEKTEEDKELTPKEKGIKALAALAESFGDSQEYTSTPGYMIEGTSISTPEIRRYEAGGIASLEPEMMADGGIAKFVGGGIVRGAIKKGRKIISDVKKKKADRAQEKADKAKAKADEAEAKAKKAEAEVEETGVTKDKPEGPGYLDFVPGAYAGLITGASKKAMDAARAAKGKTKPIVGAIGAYGVPAAVGYGAYDYFTGDEKKPPGTGSGAATVPEIEESDALLDIIRQTSLERAQAAGRTEPSFVDYLASFPSSYMEKVERDPEFAKQMMAGFAAMGKTTEGFAPRNALTDFVQGVEAERIRQEDATPDQLKLIKAIEADPDALQTLRDLARPEVDPDKRATLGSLLLDDAKKVVGASVNRTIGRKEELVDSDGQLVTVGKLISVYESGGQPALDQYYRTLLPLEG